MALKPSFHLVSLGVICVYDTRQLVSTDRKALERTGLVATGKKLHEKA